MRLAWLTLLGLFVVGCSSPSPPKKPSPYHYTTNAPMLTHGTHRKEPL